MTEEDAPTPNTSWKDQDEVRLFSRSRRLGDSILMTAVTREMKKARPDTRIVVESHWPQIFLNNRDVDAFFPAPNEPAEGTIELDYEHPWPPPERKHVIEILCERLGLRDPELAPRYQPLPMERAKSRLIRPPSTRPLLIVQPFNGFFAARSKQWDFRHWKRFLELLPPEIETVRFGDVEDPATPTERPNHREIVGMELRLAAAMIQSADAFVGQDSGFAHLATALGVPCVVIFTGYVPPEMFGYEQNVNLVPELPYAPCWQKDGCKPCGAEICTRAVQPETVLEKTLDVLDRSLARSRKRLW